MVSLARMAVATRAFSLAAVLGLMLTQGGNSSLPGLVLVGAVALLASLLTPRGTVSPTWVTLAEACLVSVLLASDISDYALLIPYLATPALISGLYRGVSGLGIVLSGELLALASVSALTHTPLDARLGEIVFTSLITGLGLGLLGSFVRSVYLQSTVADESYRDARHLLSQLRALSGHLIAGLDPVGIADNIMGIARDDLGAFQAAIFTRAEGGAVSPLRYSDSAAIQAFHGTDDLVNRCWDGRRPLSRGQLRALPLRVDSRMVGVLLLDRPDPHEEDAFDGAARRLDTESLRLDTALLFDEVRSAATNEERQRLAREVHDGVAQDVASLGYLVDDLVATAHDSLQMERLRELRQELTKVVAELRLSVFDLRSDVRSSDGLGSSISAFARQIGSRSDLTVHLTLDEGSTRLRPDVESELLRIAQEAMNNARKHAHADNLWVSCTVHPPNAEIVVRDDGTGLGKSREDSHGLRIMRERADQIGAALEIGDATGGVQLVVRLGAPTAATESADDAGRVVAR
jgi:signal transduction histidine kinase